MNQHESQLRTSPRRMRRGAALFLSLVISFGPGCASITGLASGIVTGAIDAPAQVYRHNRATMDNHPEYWIFNIAIFVPLGLAFGPIAGLVKGVALDVQWLIHRIRYKRVFNSYKDASIWRPYTIHW